MKKISKADFIKYAMNADPKIQIAMSSLASHLDGEDGQVFHTMGALTMLVAEVERLKEEIDELNAKFETYKVMENIK